MSYFRFIRSLFLELGEHPCRARGDQLDACLIQVVRRDDLVLDDGHKGRPRLDAGDLIRPSLREVSNARYTLHVLENRDAELGSPLVPRVKNLYPRLDLGLAQILFMVRQPYVLERIQVAAGEALEHRAEVEGPLELHIVTHLVAHDDLGQVRDGDVLGPPDTS
jgi:hypothetical protein